MGDEERDEPMSTTYIQVYNYSYNHSLVPGYLVVWEVGSKLISATERQKIYRKLDREMLRIFQSGGRMQKIHNSILLVDSKDNALRIAKLLKTLGVKVRIFKVTEEVEVE
jgi:hypothetical protein